MGRHGSETGEAARRAIVEQSWRKRNGPATNLLRFDPQSNRLKTAELIDCSHVFISAGPVDDRFDDRINLRIAIESQRTSTGTSSSSSCVLPLLLLRSSSLFVISEISFAADERPTPLLLGLYARFLLLLLLSSSALAPIT